jgi:hypothetical protein
MSNGRRSTRPSPRAIRMQLLALLALAVLGAALLAGAALTRPELPFLVQDLEDPWLAHPRAPRTHIIRSDLGDVAARRFERRFSLASGAGEAWLELRALRGFEVHLNGVRLGERAWREGNWRRPTRLPLGDAARAGENHLVVDVRNPYGPALLQARIEGVALAEAGPWRVTLGAGAPVEAIAADDRRLPPLTLTQPSTGALARSHAVTLGLAFLAGALAFAAVRARPGRLPVERAPTLAAVAVAALWAGLFGTKLVELPLRVGFDAPSHLEYIRFILERGALPLADDGWSMYQPPLPYALSAGLLAVGGVALEADAARWLLRLLPFLAGLGQVALAGALAQRLFAGDPLRCAAAILAGGLLPMNVYSSAYVSNEPIHGVLAGAALVWTCVLLGRTSIGAGAAAALGALLGLALLSKITSFLLLPIVLVFVAGKVWRCDAAPPGRALATAATVAASAALVCGWYFVRNALAFGNPIVGNWDVPGVQNVWWQDPGFHTPDYYLSFGTALWRPIFAGFNSFWDGLWATLWSDGLFSGAALEGVRGGFRAVVERRAELWSYDFVALASPLALPAAALVLLGLGRMARVALGDADPRRRASHGFALTAVVAMGLAIFGMTVRLPFYAQAKAFYGLAVTAPLAVALADGFAAAVSAATRPGWAWAGALLYGWAAAFAAVVALSMLA